MFLETPFEPLQRSWAKGSICLRCSNLVKHVFDLIKDMSAFIGNLPGCLFGLGGMYGVGSLQRLPDLFEH